MEAAEDVRTVTGATMVGMGLQLSGETGEKEKSRLHLRRCQSGRCWSHEAEGDRCR